MSNSVGHGLLRPTVLEHQTKTNSNGIGGNTSFQVQTNSQIRTFSSSSSASLLSSDFRGQRLTLRKSKLPRNRAVSGVPQAVLATETASELVGKFKLDGNIEMQVKVKASSVTLVEIQITNSPDHLYLHWGGMRKRKENWLLPSRRPEGTKVFNDQALRTPFVKSGSDSFLKVEIDDPAIEAIEFLIVDERQNRWYKDDNKNFYVKVPFGEKSASNVEVPEELVQIQSYLRWERNGKQSYSPEQEKKEFEEARKELQRELEKGTSLDDLRKKMTKGEIQTTDGGIQNKDQKQPAKKVYSTPERINRKTRDIMQLLKKPTPVASKGTVAMKPKVLSALQLFSKAIEEQTDADVLNKKIYRLGDKELLVLVTNASNMTRVHLATNVDGPFTLHWAISEKNREWLASSVSLDKAAETQFSTTSVDGSSDKVGQEKIDTDIGVRTRG
ncbi:hypothetical protein Tco_1288951, partial [Tanacetum coccineum]